MKELYYLSKDYTENKRLKLLIDCLPGGGVITGILSNYHSSQQAKRLNTFFEALDKSGITVTEKDIEDDDFLHKFYITTRVVTETHRKEKIDFLANLFKNNNSNLINKDTDYYESYLQILDDLTFQEITILKMLKQKEVRFGHHEVRKMMIPSLFIQLLNEIANLYSITVNEALALTSRIQRTGCLDFASGSGQHSILAVKSAATTDVYDKLCELCLLD